MKWNSRGAAALGAAALLITSFGLAGVAEAGSISITQDTGKYTGANGGGENKVTLYTGGQALAAMGSGVQVGGGVFETFCLEANEGIQVNHTYSFTTDTAAVAGGYSGVDGTTNGQPSDSLDSRTAYLFTKFWAGTLSNYNYAQGGGRVSSATSLQLAIWQLEGENATAALMAAYNANAQAKAWVAEANAAVLPGGSFFGQGIGNIRVINPTDTGGENVQSLLVDVVTVVTPIPLPPAYLAGLGLLGSLGGLGLLRRTRRTDVV